MGETKMVTCPKCGKEVKEHGLKMHDYRVHGKGKAKPKTTPAPQVTLIGTRVNRAPYAIGLYLNVLKAEAKAEKKEAELNQFLVTLSDSEFREYMAETMKLDAQFDAKQVVKARR